MTGLTHNQPYGEEPPVVELEEWMPITESGDRWRPRSKKQAREDMREFATGAVFSDGKPMDGITHCLKRTVRIEFGPWERA